MALRIAFDLDGVLADMESELVRQADLLFGDGTSARASGAASDVEADNQTAVEAAPDNVPPLVRMNLNERQLRRLWRHVESIENFWGTLKECEPGAIARLAALASDLRWELIFLTKRPESAGLTAQRQTQRWLESNGFALPSVYVVQGSRGRIAAALGLDIVVDDRPENCLDVVTDSRARAILVWREDEKLLPAAARRVGIGVVRSVNECLDILMEVDRGTRQPATLKDRMRRLLGLKQPAEQQA